MAAKVKTNRSSAIHNLNKGFTTCGMDKLLSFFKWDINHSGHVIPVHETSLEMEEELLALDYSNKHLAVALSDNTVKLFVGWGF